jgi:hypothetical protein
MTTAHSHPVPLVDALNTVVDRFAKRDPFTSERHPRLRPPEERAPLAGPVRLGVLLRDSFRCAHCGFSVRRELAEVDHIRPWSAGGSDFTSNLRTMCSPCNQARSNFIDADETPRLPVTFWCDGCVSETFRTSPGRILLAPREGHSCWYCRQDWWQAIYTTPEARPADSPHAAIATPHLVTARCLHCHVETETRWSL